MQNSASGLQDLAATFDEMRAGQGQLGIWIVDAQGKAVYGGPAPEPLDTVDGKQVVLQAADGGRMRGLRVAMNDRILPGAQLTVAVSTRTSSQFLRDGSAGRLGRAPQHGAHAPAVGAGRAHPARQPGAAPAAGRHRPRTVRTGAFVQPHAGAPADGLPADGRFQCRRRARAAHAAGHAHQRRPGHAVVAARRR
ncbi:hypothetical protein G6F31_015546 [Rhizopus arrhizus]|nr:hypothetical protein G6F31_015546 [Rhizopus arrhizus]